LLKLFTQVGFLVLVTWVVASAVVAHANADKPKRQSFEKRHSKGDRWANSIVQGEKCESANFQPVPLAPYQA